LKTLTYNSSKLSAKDRLTISSLLSLFGSRLTAKWVAVNQGQGAVPNVVLVDGDQPEGREALAASSSRQTILPVTEDDRWPHSPFVARPIRAYGPNGVIVLLNSLGQSLPAFEKERSDQRPEASRFRMTGGFEVSPAPVRTIRPPAPAPAPEPPPKPVSRPVPPPEQPRVRTETSLRAPAPASPPPQPVSQTESPRQARAEVRWGPPQPVILPQLTRMPNARIHLFGTAAQRPEAIDFQPPPAPPDAGKPTPENAPARSWHAPEPETSTPLLNMPVAHKPVEVHRPPMPVIGRARLEEPTKRPMQDDSETHVLRTSPPQWRAPEPESVSELFDLRSLTQEILDEPSASAPQPPIEIAAPDHPIVVPNETISSGTRESPVELLEPAAPDLGAALVSMSDAIASESVADELEDLGVDWWGEAQLELAGTGPAYAQSEEASLLSALKAIKASKLPSILEIGGLPAVCVIPARNVYFTTAPAARLETAMGAQADVTWRTCASEAEARQISGTEQSRQASLEQLYWTASLFSGAADVERLADRAVRLRRWPPLTESRGRSKFVRYATLLSGAQATPRELAEITGDGLEEIVAFVHACAEMNLLEAPGKSAAPLAAPPLRAQGAGILRSIIEQLTPPRI
jgi:hypothetical protein